MNVTFQWARYRSRSFFGVVLVLCKFLRFRMLCSRVVVLHLEHRSLRSLRFFGGAVSRYRTLSRYQLVPQEGRTLFVEERPFSMAHVAHTLRNK